MGYPPSFCDDSLLFLQTNAEQALVIKSAIQNLKEEQASSLAQIKVQFSSAASALHNYK
jgi:hypothetical protein